MRAIFSLLSSPESRLGNSKDPSCCLYLSSSPPSRASKFSIALSTASLVIELEVVKGG